ncbi:MAG TPA: glutamate-5-semialdehyde dehydrogenase [Candidatus Paceibacterota bacterium]|nr:glutamate-5-semialdehyde dehydrogenase [Verrucomicrobiota bacterium]HRZ43835.1 glutamate-5-semialdehyde dehydrogenase [Candidatus Paceibacterota bacterium]HRZ93082.1 glutamate-5-semialdehyde dehydrogenase [Candidatus Paceibacterota bacterium]
MTLRETMRQLASRAKESARELGRLSREEKDACLRAMAEALDASRDLIARANAEDMAGAAESGISAAMLDRLRLDDRRIDAMIRGLRDVAGLPDPVGRVLDDRVRPNGLRLRKVAVPIGVIVIIYESRPNVTVDSAGLCFKSGNATILRGGKEARRSSQALVEALVEAGRRTNARFPAHAIQRVETTDRDAIRDLLACTESVDLCIPRGGEGLIRAVSECSRVPVIKHYKGVCHVYVDGEADPAMASEIVLNAKVQRPGVCNAMETLLVDAAIAPAFLPDMARKLAEKSVELRVDDRAAGLLPPDLPRVKPASEEDWHAEYLDLILAVRVVDGVEEAIRHIHRYGSAHSDAIVTRNEDRARQFLAEVDSAAVYWNASTRFTDGGEFGLGAEIGISTDKVGARGPMGLEELTTYKWIGLGTGQVRK